MAITRELPEWVDWCVLLPATMAGWPLAVQLLPARDADAVAALCCLGFALCAMTWNWTCTAIARVTAVRGLPGGLRRAAHAYLRRIGTRRSRALAGRLAAAAVGAALSGTAPAVWAFEEPPDVTWVGTSAAVGPPDHLQGPVDSPGSTAVRTDSSGGDAATAVHVVRPGDCLWTITADHLAALGGRVPTDAQIAGAWPDLHRLNATAIGADPRLIHPGTPLALPRDWTASTEERP